ncbi:MAG: right-handed parallel beta-helix repeat-containing protein [Bacillota bacterium]|nr:right-handed parallel beta-helix repeat-containing protein [Bacillota bacterium]
MKKRRWIYLIAAAVLAFCMALTGCGGGPASGETTSEIHISAEGNDDAGDGSAENPYRSIARGAAEAGPGSIVVIHDGEYDQFEIDSSMSGTADAPVTFRAAKGETPVIKPAGSGGEDNIGIHIVNADNLTIRGLEVQGGTHGIFYESTPAQGAKALENITIRDCTVHGIRGTHGICAYARNDLAPVKNLVMTGCRVYDCQCGSSEATAFNGNIDGFTISGNEIHDNNNIGIDMIGFEGTARHAKGSGADDPYEVDFVRNGKCFGNIVYNISAAGNDAYLENGAYDLCADGIYVDGGQDIEICENYIHHCDIGLEVATEHSPEDNARFKVSGVEVHDNVIADCTGWCGMSLGGYDSDRGFTENCEFVHNTLVDNKVQVGIQRSKGNTISANLLVGGEMAFEYNEDCRPEEMRNDISGNAACEIDGGSWEDSYGKAYENRDKILDGFRSLIEGCGSGFAPDVSD